MVRLGDAILKVTGAARINYEILGNSELSFMLTHAMLTSRTSIARSQPGSTIGRTPCGTRKLGTDTCVQTFAPPLPVMRSPRLQRTALRAAAEPPSRLEARS